MNQSQVSPIGLLETHQNLAKAVHPRMASFHNPPSCTMIRIRGFFLSLLATGADVGSVASLFHRLAGLCAVKGLVSTQMLRFFRCGFRAIGHNTVQDRFHLSDIMTVGSGYNDGERGTSTVHQDVSLRSLFFPDPSDWLRRTPVREELSSLHHPCFASPRQSPANRHNPSNRPARVLGKTQLGPIPRSAGDNGAWTAESLLRQGLPLTTCPQYIHDAFKNLPVWQRSAPATGGPFVFLVRISRRPWNQRLHLLPQSVGYFP